MPSRAIFAYSLPVPPILSRSKVKVALPKFEDLIREEAEGKTHKLRDSLTTPQLNEFVQILKREVAGLGGAHVPDNPADFAIKFSAGEWENAPHLRVLSNHIKKLERREIRFLTVSMPPRSGKQLAHDTLVPTPSGFKQHGDLKVGDLVFGRDGYPYPVLALGEETFENDIQLTFSNGSSITCHGEHEWLIYDRAGGKERIMEAREILARQLDQGVVGTRGHRYTLQLPLIDPVWGETKKLPLDPYILGAWLGDGKSDAGSIAHHDSDRHVIERVAEFFPVQNVYINKKYPRVSQTLFTGLRGALKKVGVLNNKHIPISYLAASVGQRRQLLAGLIDTDGCVGGDGRVHFSNINRRLIEDVTLLVRSLGYRTSLHETPPKLSTSGIQGKHPVFVLSFSPHDQEIASMPRKRHGILSSRLRLAVIRAERVTPKRGRCIQTASPDGIYLASTGYIPTHNSQLTSIWTPTWWLSRNPRDRIILAGYGETFARDWGAKVRDKMIEHADSLNLVLSSSKLAADDWELSTGGGMVCVGVGGSLVGRGANILIIDDPIKNDQEASSLTYRDRMWDWFQASAFTRLQPNGVMVVMATRWHEDDLIGRILKNDTAKLWTSISIPALAEKNDILGRAEGAPLWPEHFTDDPDYSIRKASMSPYWFASQYQQRPSPEGGGIIREDWFQFYDLEDADTLVKEADQVIQTWDPALLDKASSDYWVGQVLARKGADIYVIAQARGHFNLAQATGVMKNWANKYPKAVAKLIENTAMGPAIKQTLQHEVPGIIPISAKGTKRSRIEAAIPCLMAQNVHLPQHRNGTKPQWVWDLISEACAYDKGTYDDQIDCLSQGINFMTPGGWREAKRLAKEHAPIPTPQEMQNQKFSNYAHRVLEKATRKFSGRKAPRRHLW